MVSHHRIVQHLTIRQVDNPTLGAVTTPIHCLTYIPGISFCLYCPLAFKPEHQVRIGIYRNSLNWTKNAIVGGLLILIDFSRETVFFVDNRHLKLLLDVKLYEVKLICNIVIMLLYFLAAQLCLVGHPLFGLRICFVEIP
jgi:hypothetical protein